MSARVVGFAPVRREVPDVMTVEDVAALLRVSRQHVYNEVSRGRIPHRRVGNAIRFSRRLVIAWLEGAA